MLWNFGNSYTEAALKAPCQLLRRLYGIVGLVISQPLWGSLFTRTGRLHNMDFALLFCSVAATIVGILMVYSATKRLNGCLLSSVIPR